MELNKRRNGSLELGSMMYGKIPPQAKDIEMAVLGGILLDKKVFDIVAEVLSPQTFYVDAHQKIFSAMMSMSQKNSPIDLLTIVEELKFREELDLVGGPYYITKLTDSVVSTANIESYCRIVLQKFIQREIIRIGGEMVGDAYEDNTDVFELLDKVESNVFNLTLNHIKKDYNHISTGLIKVIQKIELLRQLDEIVTGVPSGFREVDKIIHGWQPSDLIILAARPSVGKTAFALNLARNAATHHTRPTAVGFFSLEMSEDQLIKRALSSESKIWLERLNTGKIDEQQMKTLYNNGVNPLSQCPIYIDDTASINMFELRAKARRMKNKHKVGLIIIDYLQLMGSTDEKRTVNREQEISRISRDLKKLSKNLEIPVIAISQLSREVEKRGKGLKVPQLSDLRESGAIEQDADIVMFLYRPPDDEVKEDPELANTGLLKISKHRNGKLDQIAFSVDNSIQQWTEKGSFNSAPSSYKPYKQADNEQLLKKNEEDYF